MVAPVTGPFTTSVGGTGSPEYYSLKVGYKQVRPIDQPLAYERRIGETLNRVNATGQHARTAAGWDIIGEYVGSWAVLENYCYDKLKSRISDRANWAVNLAEASQSLSMIRTRAMQLAAFAIRLKKLDFVGAARTLKLAAVPKRASVKKSFANNYLEFHFGWAPLIGDIYSSVDVLQQPVKAVIVTAKGYEEEKVFNLSPEVHLSNPTAVYPANLTQDSWRRWRLDKKLRMGVEVAVNNPNLWLANQLGLVNPALVAYELVPFSFVLNWFVNVEQFLSSGTDFYGLTLKNGWTTYRCRGTYEFYNKATYRWLESGVWKYGSSTNEYNARVVHLKRRLGIVKPTFIVRPWQPWSWRRTASAVSLVVQRLK
jgi:hypothetical protein